jgi:hypothetical protein
MPKKSATARSGAQRQRPKTQKSFELVRPTPTLTENTATTTDTLRDEEPAGQGVATMTATSRAAESDAVQHSAVEETPDSSEEVISEPVPVSSSRKASTRITSPVTSPISSTPISSSSRGGASARFAARRQAQQKAQQKNAASLVTTEHFAYVRHDLIIIAALATIMFAAIIILYFTLGR